MSFLWFLVILVWYNFIGNEKIPAVGCSSQLLLGMV